MPQESLFVVECRQEAGRLDYQIVRPLGNQIFMEESDAGCIIGNFRLFHQDTAATRRWVRELLVEFQAGRAVAACRTLDGEYGFVYLDKQSGQVSVVRDPSGVQSLYYTVEGDRLVFGSRVQAVLQQRRIRRFSLPGVAYFMFYEFVFEPYTLFDGVLAAERGALTTFSGEGQPQVQTFRKRLTEVKEGALAPDYFTGLRDHIVRAYERRLSSDNALYLSGGIDSNVGAIVLKRVLGLENLRSFTFGVRGAEQSEVHVAESVAKSVGLEHTSVLVDPNAQIDLPDMLSSMDFPYVGMVAISAMGSRATAEGFTNLNFFTGQDTRLHTPHVNVVDQLLLGKWRAQPVLRRLASEAAQALAPLPVMGKTRKAIDRLSNANALDVYLRNHFYHRHGRSIARIDAEYLDFDRLLLDRTLQVVRSSESARELFNGSVDIAWDSQYVGDIAYVRDSTALHGNTAAFPYYDVELALYSAAIPFDLATKKTRGVAGHSARPKWVDKFVLRQAFKNELSDELIYRDKAVCITNHLFLNGCMRPYVDEYLNNSALHESAVYQQLALEPLRQKALARSGTWQLTEYEEVVEVQNLLFLETLARMYQVS